MGVGSFSEVSGAKYEMRKGKSSDVESYDIFSVPNEIIVEILCHVPAKDLIKSCTLVCRMWMEIIEGQMVWKKKCLREGRFVPPVNLEPIPKHFFRNIYLKNPYGRNLIKSISRKERSERNLPAMQNHFASMWNAVFHPVYPEDARRTLEFAPWTVTSNEGDGWIVEDPPVGADPVPGEGDQSCFATSYSSCTKHQLIHLIKEGVNEEIMDVVKPKIIVSEWHAARFDCGSVYLLEVVLLSKHSEPLAKFEYGPFKEEQWSGRQWTQVKHQFEDYPAGVRYIFFEHSGQDTQFWSGHYGSKMAKASVTFDFT